MKDLDLLHIHVHDSLYVPTIPFTLCVCMLRKTDIQSLSMQFQLQRQWPGDFLDTELPVRKATSIEQLIKFDTTHTGLHIVALGNDRQIRDDTCLPRGLTVIY